MLSKMIVSSYAMLVEISLWLSLIVFLIVGWNMGGFFGALGGLIVGFLFLVMFGGIFLVINDIRDSVRKIESKQ